MNRASLELLHAYEIHNSMLLTTSYLQLVPIHTTRFWGTQNQREFPVFILAFGHATRSVIVRNQMGIDKNLPITGNPCFIILNNSPKFEYRELVSAI